jgi:hypothetical protein
MKVQCSLEITPYLSFLPEATIKMNIARCASHELTVLNCAWSILLSTALKIPFIVFTEAGIQAWKVKNLLSCPGYGATLRWFTPPKELD